MAGAPTHIVVVGHGPIGQSFIEKLTEKKADFQISVLCEEPRPAYNRVMLTQYFQDRDGDKRDQMKLSYCTEESLKELGVKLVYGRAVSIDRDTKTVGYISPSVGECSITYDKLVMATGSYCFVPPTPGMTVPEKKNPQWPDDPASRPEGVFVYRTIEDLDAMIAAAKGGARKAAVIGGGLLGLEAAKAVYDLKMESHVLEMAPYLMPTQLNEAAGTVLVEKIEALDIKVHIGVKIQEVVHKDGKIFGVKVLEEGAEEATIIEIDMLVVSCGVRPRDELARGCGLEIGSRGGIKVDAGLRSSDPDIYAIGEVAAIGGNMCYGLWAPGVEQAEVLVTNLVDGTDSAKYYKSDLSTKLKLMGVDVASFGRDESFWFQRQFDCKDKSKVVALENANPFEGTYKKLCFAPDGKKLLGGLLVGDAKDYTKLLQLSKKDPEFVVPDINFKLAVTAEKLKEEPAPAPPKPAKPAEEKKKTVIKTPTSDNDTGIGGNRIVVVGHGPIGQSFIEKLVEKESEYEISVVCEEPRPAYNRVMLTQYFKDRDGDKHDQMKLSYTTEEQLRKWHVNLVYGRAVSIERESKSLVYTTIHGSQSSLRYDKLVMATGSYCFIPPTPGMIIPEKKNPQWPDDPASRPEGVFVYRTIEDLEAMIAAAKGGARKAAVIGGGLLGLEAAKAVYDLKMESHVLEMAPYLMPTQLNEAAGTVLTKKIEDLDIKVHAGVKIHEVVHEAGKVVGIKVLERGSDEPTIIPVDIVVVSCGVRPRDELAKACGLEIGARGGVKVDTGLRSSDPDIYAIGEVASIGGNMCYGLWAPGVEQAEVLVKNLTEGPETAEYHKSDLSTKLKLMGVDVASFGRNESFWFKRQFDEKDPEILSLECSNKLTGSYRKLCFSKDGSQLMGGLLVGDAKDYTKLLQLSKKPDLGNMDPESLTYQKPPPGSGGAEAAADGGDGTGLADDDLVCTCIGLSKKNIIDCIKDKDATTVPMLKKACKVGSGCGGCITPVGAVPKVLASTLKKLGKTGPVGICQHFPFSRADLFTICKIKELKSFADVLANCGKGSGCEICKPIIGSIIAGLFNDHILKGKRLQLQDTNDRFLANVQKTGTYSVIPRTAAGDISPQQLETFALVAKKYGLWTKITGAQRMGMFGAQHHQLPAIWKELVDAGFESGQAYGKALRAVKSCVGSTWCRYGQQDSVTMAVILENRYKGIRSPHKLKMGVSGCLRECAEAQGKDIGVICTQKGYNLYVCGNGGARPVHAALFATDIDEDTLLQYIDRVLMWYISTAKHLERTAPWLQNLPGGLTYLKKVIIDDCLGICADLDKIFENNHTKYHCEWREIAYDEEAAKHFRQFVNTDATLDNEQIEYVDMRLQRHPNTYSLPDITGPAIYLKESAPTEGSTEASAEGWCWIFGGKAYDYQRNLGFAILHGTNELAVFFVCSSTDETSAGQWYCTQNLSPNKQSRTISRGLVGQQLNGQVTVAEPIWKTTYDINTGKGLANPALNLSTFNVRETGGDVLVWVPSAKVMSAAFAKQVQASKDAAGFVHPGPCKDGINPLPQVSKKVDVLDW